MYKISKNYLHMNDTNIDTQYPIFKILQEMNTSYHHTRPTTHTKRDPTTRNIQNSYTEHRRKTNTPTKYNITTIMTEEQYIT
jgi:hypothetical protein